jgi:hypothetical protein
VGKVGASFSLSCEMSKHAAFAEDTRPTDEEKHAVKHVEGSSFYDGSSIAPTGTRGSESDHSEAGMIHKAETARATRKLLLKMGELVRLIVSA